MTKKQTTPTEFETISVFCYLFFLSDIFLHFKQFLSARGYTKKSLKLDRVAPLVADPLGCTPPLG